MPSARLSAIVFSGLIAPVCVFQLALALGAPLGAYAMGGAYPGVLPASMRLAAVLQVGVLAFAAAVILSRAGVVLPAWARASRWMAWIVVGLMALSLVLNMITPSPVERMVWAPVAGLLLISGLRVAWGR
jgi:hypothetical protein